MASRARPPRGALLAVLGHLLLAAFVFRDVVFGGVLFMRDLSSQYYPDYTFATRALRQGVWPLWNPSIHAGAPWLLAYPPDLLLLLLGGPGLALGLGVVLHLALAMLGAHWLARELGREPLPAFLAGAAYGLSGTVLSLVNLLPLFQGAAWLPATLAALLRLLRSRGPRSIALFAALLALQVSTLAAETVAQAGLAVLFLVPLGELRRGVSRLLAGGLLALLLAAPALVGALSLLPGSARARGFLGPSAFAFSAPPLALLDAVVPAFFGNVHSFANATYWGEPFFPEGFPYLLSLYLGLPMLLLAAFGRDLRLLALAGAGVLLALGDHGPLQFALVPWLTYFRAPVKFFLLATLALSLLAGEGLERAGASSRSALTLVPGLLLLAAGALAGSAPTQFWSLLGTLVPRIATAAGRAVVLSLWPPVFLVSGGLTLLTGLLLRSRPRFAGLAVATAIAELATQNATLNRSAPSRFYELRPEVRPLVEAVSAAAPARVFSYGVAYSAGLPWAKGVAARDEDAWLYYMDRQSLLPRTHVLDGLEGALEPDRTGWAPAGASLSVAQAASREFPRVAERLSRANVRFVFSFEPLPAEQAVERARASLPEILVPLRLYELPGAWPRAFYLPSLDGGATPPAEAGQPIEYRRTDPHHLTLRTRTPPGFVVVLDGYHAAWRARTLSGEVALRRFGERYLALPTPGGEQDFELRFAPSWPRPALAVSGLGILGLAACGWAGRRSTGT